MTVRPRRLALLALVLAAATPASAQGDRLVVEIDHARVLKLPRPATTVIIGNPAIADVTVQDASTIVLTGRSYGATNLIVLDAKGEAMVDESVGVKSFEEGTVRVYRQASRQTVACLPECEPTVTIGDDVGFFDAAVTQFTSREALATAAAK